MSTFEQLVTSTLGSANKQTMQTFLGWSKEDRDSAVANCSKDIQMIRDTRIVQNNYSRQETISMLDSIASTVRAAVSSSHEKLTQSVAELVRAVLADAETQSVILNVKPLESLNTHRNLSAADLSFQKSLAGPRPGALAPIGSGAETTRQLQQANETIRTLREKLKTVEERYRNVMDEKSRLTGANLYLGDQLTTEEQRLSQERASSSASITAATSASQKSVEELQQDIQQMKEVHQKDIQQMKEAHRKEVTALTHKVSELNREQQGKLSQSAQFQAMKKMLREKTDQVKKLRELLKPYNPSAAAGGDDDIATDEDDD